MNIIGIDDLAIDTNFTLYDVVCVVTDISDTSKRIGDKGGLEFDSKTGFKYQSLISAIRNKDGSYNFNNSYCSIEIKDRHEEKFIKKLLLKKYRCLVKVLSENEINEKKHLHLKLAFMHQGEYFGKLPIVISDKVKKNLSKNNHLQNNDELMKILHDNFIFSDGKTLKGCFAYFQSYRYDELDYEETNKQLEDSKIVKQEEDSSIIESNETDIEYNNNYNNTQGYLDVEEINKGFTLCGKNFNIVVSLTKDGRYLIANKIIFSRKKLLNLYMGEGELVFTDRRERIDESVSKLLGNKGEYIEIWNKYSNIEGEFMLKHAREIGYLTFNNTNGKSIAATDEGNIMISLENTKDNKNTLKRLRLNDSLDFYSVLPSYLVDNTISWVEYKSGKKGIEKDKDANHGIIEHLDNIDKLPSKNSKPIIILDINISACMMTVSKFDIINEVSDKNKDETDHLKKHKNNISELFKNTKAMEKGYFVFSLRGTEVQIKRRESARNDLINHETPNSRIADIIANNIDENNIAQITYQDDIVSNISGISPLVKKKIFNSQPPTSVQVQAIETALNTPDIAIIQGPPGTGKTTVITAILERFNELTEKTGSIKGRILVTSLQHDAVNNVIERVCINSLPTIKFGRKNNDENMMEATISKWCDDVRIKLCEKNPSLAVTNERKELNDKFIAYQSNPCDEKTIVFLEYLKKISYDSNINTEIDAIISNINSEHQVNDNDTLWYARRLRTNIRAFMDDGFERAYELYLHLINKLHNPSEQDKKILKLLEKAFDLKYETSSFVIDILKKNNCEFLKELRKIKLTLINQCIPQPIVKMDVIRDDVLMVYQKIEASLRKPTNEEDNILLELLNELEYNTMEVRNVVAQYSYVFAANAQQSEGKDIKDAKGIDKKSKDKHPTYDVVIVDEAARVNPCDLMIPLSQAVDKIVLVGDHRQLPHMYDEEIIEILQESNKFNPENVKKSMFEHLVEKAKLLEKIDGRKRFITLNKQYRMHPLLGNFVSDEFYKQYGEAYDSPLGEEFFQQNYFEKPLVWYNVPNSVGHEEKIGTSRRRLCEVDFLVTKIMECLHVDDLKITSQVKEKEEELSKEGRGSMEIKSILSLLRSQLERERTSYGVITFYSAQVNEIKKKLINELGSPRFDDLYIRQKLRVGSIDAFQGMEFDIIFLSIVRSGKHLIGVDNDEDIALLKSDNTYTNPMLRSKLDKIAVRNYGFLTSPNRMCVAMSRQKKALVVVGDSNIFCGEMYKDIAERFVPGMKHLYELCCQKGIVMDI